jgi:hypothetical protein
MRTSERRSVLAAYVLAALAAAAAAGCGSKGGGAENPLAGAKTFGGLYPAPEIVHYDDRGRPADVLAFPGHVQVFFGGAHDPKDAAALFAANGGTILSQIPAAGYFLAGVTPGAEAAFTSSLAADPNVFLAQPHVAPAPKFGVSVFDLCGESHAEAIRAALEAAGGSLEACRPIGARGARGTETPPDLVLRRLAEAAARGGKKGAIVNLSVAGGLDGVDWTLQSPAGQGIGLDGWRHFARAILAFAASLPASQRANLAIVMAAGNENMPLDSVLAELRAEDPRLADALTNNLLVVTTTLTSGNGNASLDSDIAIVNNQEASLGTSLAAPAAAAILQHVAVLAPGTNRQAILGAKVAVGKNPDHLLVESEAIDAVRRAGGGNPRPCNRVTRDGGDLPETHSFELARTSGTFDFTYDTFGIEDRMIVKYEGKTIFDTGCVGTTAPETVAITYNGTSTTVTVQVTPNCAGGTSGTAWEFTVGCPTP